MKSTAPNPYRRNVELLRGFFRKPVTLITGLVFSLSYIVLTCCSAFFSDSIHISLDILFGIGFLLLFSDTVKSSAPTFKLPSMLIKVSSIISYAFCIVAVVASIIISLLFYFIFIGYQSNPVTYSDLIPALITFSSFLLICIIPMIFYIHLSRLMTSIKKSANSVYLYRKGAFGVGIFGILTALITLFSSIVSPILQDILDSINFLLTEPTSTVAFGIQLDFSVLFDSLTYYDLASAALSCLSMVVVSVFGFKYNNYIKNITEGLTPSHQTKDNEPVSEVSQADNKDNPYLQTGTTPINTQDFVPQAVFKTTNENKKICPRCKMESDNSMCFCPHCGTKL